MNKFLKKVAATFLGFAMVAGAGVAISSQNHKSVVANAEQTISFAAGDFSAATEEATSASKNGVTIDISKGTISSPQIRIFKSQTLTVSCSDDIKEIVFTCTASDTNKYGPGCFTTSSGYTYSGTTGTWSGTSKSVEFTASSNQVRATAISVKIDSGDTPASPTLTVAPTSLAIAKNGSGSLTATAENGTGDVSWVSSNPTIASVSAATGSSITVNAGSARGKTSITVSYSTANDVVVPVTVTDIQHAGTENDPYTPEEARDKIDTNTGLTGVYVSGIVSEIVDAYSSQYHNISYNISSDGETTSEQLEAFRGKSYNGDDFTSENDIQVGDEVVVYGTLVNYQGTYELAQNNQLVSLHRASLDTYSVAYNANGGEGAPATDSGIDANDALAYELAGIGDLSRDGYEADGWATSADGSKAYDFGEEVDLTSISTNNALTLFAHWVKVINPNKIVFSEEGLDNGVQYNTFGTASDSDGSDRSSLNFTVEFSGGGNDGKYYDTGTGIRTYGGGSIEISAKNSKKLAKVTFVWSGSSYKPGSDYSVTEGTYTTSTGIWTGLANSITISKQGDGQWRLQSIEIEIGATLVTGITVSPASLNILSDDTTDHTITVTVSPNDADNSAVTISSDNTNVASVSEEGLTGSGTFIVTGKEATSGTQIITVSASDASGISATLTLTAVDASVPVLTGITVDQTGLSKKTQYVGDAFDPTGLTFTPVYNKTNPNPDTITSSDFTWSTLAVGQSVTGTYKEDTSITVTIDSVTVKNDVLEVTITGDELTDPNFLTSDSWNHAGITASAGYESGKSYSGSIEWSYSPETPALMGVDDAGVLRITATAGSASSYVDVLVSVSKAREVVTSRIDLIDREFTGVADQTGKTQSYIDWSNKTGSSTGTKYAGNNAGDHDSIQLRTNNSSSGIVTTTSTGYIKSVTITFNTNSADGRIVQVYGKNTAYSAPSDLYNNSNKGTQLGTATLDSNDTYVYTVEVSGEYSYVGIRSSSGALYLDKVEFTFDYVHSDADVTAVDNFISEYMHLDYDNGGTIGSITGTGLCTGYYGKDGNHNGAKYNFSQLSDTQKEIILKSTSTYGTVGNHEYTYNEVKDRLSEWARVNGETFNTSTGAFSTNRSLSLFTSETTNSVAIIVIISMVSMTAIGGYFFLRKRKEN